MSDEKPIYHARSSLPSDDIPLEAMATVAALQQRIAELEADVATLQANNDEVGKVGRDLAGRLSAAVTDIRDLEAQLAARMRERDEERARLDIVLAIGVWVTRCSNGKWMLLNHSDQGQPDWVRTVDGEYDSPRAVVDAVIKAKRAAIDAAREGSNE